MDTQNKPTKPKFKTLAIDIERHCKLKVHAAEVGQSIEAVTQDAIDMFLAAKAKEKKRDLKGLG